MLSGLPGRPGDDANSPVDWIKLGSDEEDNLGRSQDHFYTVTASRQAGQAQALTDGSETLGVLSMGRTNSFGWATAPGITGPWLPGAPGELNIYGWQDEKGSVNEITIFLLTREAKGDYCARMARKLRIQYPGAIYHVMNRGDRREDIFEDDRDRQLFLDTLTRACQKTDWQVHAYCLMSNHIHLVIETPQPNLVVGMKWLLGTYTSRYNRRHKEFGHLFSGRYKALMVEGSGNGYLKSACDYVHLNPVRAKLLRAGRPLSDFVWSSYRLYLSAPSRRPAWLRVDRLLGEWGIPKDSVAGRRVFGERMEWRRRENWEVEFKALERGWCLGGEQFRQELLEQVSTRPGPSHFGEAVQAAVEVQAERMVTAGLKRLGWSEAVLKAKRKGHLEKVRLARELRSRTTMPLAWIAERLCMGSRGYLAWLLGQEQKRPVAAFNQPLLQI